MTGPRLSIIPAGAVTDKSLEARDLQVLCLLGRHLDKLGWCVRSQVKMAAEIDCGRSSIQRSLDRLYRAGWVERKQRGQLENEDEPGRPSVSHAYRVRLDRDDAITHGVAESHAENASQEDECPPVGTGGAQPERAPRAQPYMGTNNDPLERISIEREKEKDARARDRTSLKEVSPRQQPGLNSPGSAPPLVSELAFAVAQECLATLGIDPGHPPPEWCGLAYQIQMLLAGGCSHMTIVATFARLHGLQPRPHPNYFIKAVQSASDRPLSNKGVTNGTNRVGGSTITAAIDRHIERFKQLDDGDRAVGEDPARRLSDRRSE